MTIARTGSRCVKETSILRISATDRDDPSWYQFVQQNCAEAADIDAYRAYRTKCRRDGTALAPTKMRMGRVRWSIGGVAERMKTATPEDIGDPTWESAFDDSTEWFSATIDDDTSEEGLNGSITFEYPGNHTVVTLRVHSTTVLTPLWVADFLLESWRWKERVAGRMAKAEADVYNTVREHAEARALPAKAPKAVPAEGEAPAAARAEPRRFKRPQAQTTGVRTFEKAPPPRTIVGQGDPVSLSQIAMAVGEQGADKGDPMVTIRMPDGDEAKMRLSELIMVDSPAVTWTLPKRPTKKQLAQVNASSALWRRINAFDKNPEGTTFTPELAAELRAAVCKTVLSRAKAPASAEERLRQQCFDVAAEAIGDTAVAEAADRLTTEQVERAVDEAIGDAVEAFDQAELERRRRVGSELLASDPAASDPATASPYADLGPPLNVPRELGVARVPQPKGGQYDGFSERGKKAAQWAAEEHRREKALLERVGAGVVAYACGPAAAAPVPAPALEPGAADAEAVLKATLARRGAGPRRERAAELCSRIEAEGVAYRCRHCNKPRRLGQLGWDQAGH